MPNIPDIDLKDFVNNGKTCDVALGEDRRLFKEPSIQEMTELIAKHKGEELTKHFIVEGDPKKFDNIFSKMTASSQKDLTLTILSKLGLNYWLQMIDEKTIE